MPSIASVLDKPAISAPVGRVESSDPHLAARDILEAKRVGNWYRPTFLRSEG